MSETTSPRPISITIKSNCPISPIVVCEVKALIKYASERGLDTVGTVLRPLYLAVAAYEERVLSSGTRAEEDILDENAAGQVLSLYTQLTKITYPVTGHTLLETEKRYIWSISPLYFWSLLFLLLVITNEVMKVWFAEIPEPEDDSLLLSIINLRRYVLDVCAPFLWGALGSCVWLLKRLSDYAEERTFDRSVSRGWIARVFLGAILGGAVQYIYDPSLFSNNGFKFGASAIGFLTGVGVKVVYGAIEKTIEVVAGKLNLDAAKATKNDLATVRAYLTEQLNQAERVQDVEKRKVVGLMLNELKPATKPE